ncbi:MAG: CBS domain-containing protein [Nitrospinae bacterium]|nr:CBS domain-containing protein [Nitrospinota bacterium]MBI3813888.1 CBS domain-containing protein [Nitrospinota bacterium]
MELFKKAKGIMTKGNFITTGTKAKVSDITIALISGEVSGLPVVDNEKRVVGIITEFDIIRAVKQGKDLKNVTAEDIMTKNPITVNEDTPVSDIINILETKHIIRVPVVDKDGKLVGIVSRRDILKGVTEIEGAPQIWF